MKDIMSLRLINSSDLFLLEELVKKNFAAKYKDSVIGIFWSVLRPLLIMIILTIVFSTLFIRKIENFPVYMLCGKIIYDFFSSAVAVSMNSISSNKNILKRTAAPKYIFVLGSVISEFLNFLITLLILVVVMIATKAPFYFTIMPLTIIPLISEVIMIIGLGLMLSILSIYYSDVKYLWGVVMQMVFYACAIFYPMDMIPEPFHHYLTLNPLFWIIDQVRSLFLYGKIPDLVYIFNSLALSLIIFALGVIVFKKYQDKVMLKL